MASYWFSEEENKAKSIDKHHHHVDSDDFYGENDKDNNEIAAEQRHREKCFIDLNKSGYRDGLQSQMNNEELIQKSFNYSFKLNSKFAFILGVLKSAVEMNSKFVNALKRKELIQQLDTLESNLVNQFDYKSQIDTQAENEFFNEKAIKEYHESFTKSLVKFKDKTFEGQIEITQLINEMFKKA